MSEIAGWTHQRSPVSGHLADVNPSPPFIPVRWIWNPSVTTTGTKPIFLSHCCVMYLKIISSSSLWCLVMFQRASLVRTVHKNQPRIASRGSGKPPDPQRLSGVIPWPPNWAKVQVWAHHVRSQNVSCWVSHAGFRPGWNQGLCFFFWWLSLCHVDMDITYHDLPAPPVHAYVPARARLCILVVFHGEPFGIWLSVAGGYSKMGCRPVGSYSNIFNLQPCLHFCNDFEYCCLVHLRLSSRSRIYKQIDVHTCFLRFCKPIVASIIRVSPGH